jgi:DNA-binding NarL/FixJ family response regulator
MSRSRVLLADDHAIVAQGIAALLGADFDLVGTVGDGAALIEAVRRHRPEVVVADMSMPVLSGLEALRRLRNGGSAPKFVFLTMHADPKLAAEAIRAGAAGYLLKQSAGEELIAAIREVLQGRVYLTPRIAREVLAALATPAAETEPRLTARQWDVLRLIADGRTLKEIAAVLHLSPRTVETHKYDMMRSLGVDTTAALIRYALEHSGSGT